MGFLFESEIIAASEKKCEIKITNETFQKPDTFYTHTLANQVWEIMQQHGTVEGMHEYGFQVISNCSPQKALSIYFKQLDHGTTCNNTTPVESCNGTLELVN